MPTPLTARVEHFVSAPSTELRKLNKICDAVDELQGAVEELQNTPPPTFTQVFVEEVIFVNGVLRKANVCTDGNDPQSI